ncbi:MAG: ThuA domain-containing protein [Sphingomonadales bacterium]|nr:MAG: ThuA domain-containing protein [Sphingomonadales bacterium]
MIGLAFLMALAAQDAPSPQTDPRRPAPTLDSAAPTLPKLRRPAVLIFSKTNGFRHDSIPDAVAAVRKLAKARGFSTYATENAALFNREQLARFEVIVFASATGDMFTPAQRQAFEAWLASGRGFVGLHGAGDGSHPDWYQALLGYGGYTGHPGGADQFQTSDLIVTDRAHPATRHLAARWRWTEEYYAYAAPLRPDTQILARLDETGMRLEPKHSMGDKHALIWWRCEGRARIFYSALGHKPESWSDPVHLKLVDGAIRWAARRTGKGCS